MADKSGIGRLQSIRWRAALLTSGLVALVLLVFVGVTYKEVESHLERAGQEQARNAADQLTELLAQGATTRTAELRRVANAAEVREFLRAPSDETRAAATTRIRPILVGFQHQTLELWTADGTKLIALAAPVSGNVAPASTPPTEAGARPFQIASNQNLVSEVVAEVTDDSGAGSRRLGYLSSRRVAAGNATRDLLNRLVGTGAVMLVGNQGDGIGAIYPRP